jgi:hypothetical protein
MAMVFIADNEPDFLDFTLFPRSKCPNILGLDSPQYELVSPIFSYLSDDRLWRNKMISPFLPLKPLLSKCTISFVTCTLVYHQRERPGHVTWLSQHESA